MFGSDILEVAIGIIFIYILVSIICSAVREGVETWLKTRSAYLEHGIRELLRDSTGTGLAQSVYRHPLISGLYLADYGDDPPARPRGRYAWLLAKGRGLPSYIPSKNFAVALMDLAARGPRTDAFTSSGNSTPITLDSLRENVANLGNAEVQRALLTAIDTAQGDLQKVQKNLEQWYDSGMDRVSGWYKRSTQWVVLWIGFAVAVAFNVNTISIADWLYNNDAQRQVLVARAEAAARDSVFASQVAGRDSALPSADYRRARAALDSLGVPVGWKNMEVSVALVGWPLPNPVRFLKQLWLYAVSPILGWLITGVAATLGAPFWFDILNKVMVIRSTVKPREKSPEEGSEDRKAKDKTDVTVDVQTQDRGAALLGFGSPPGSLAAPPEIPPDPDDIEADVDACDVDLDEEETPDELLPMAKGGVG
jgi:hypothetical protein